ncbi:hypothetical protein U3516DRAFT_478732, partial [Neocallimastix sp. 'constans']
MECSHLHLLHSILIILVYITNINSFSLNKNNSDNFEVNEEQTDIFGIKEVESDIYGLKEEESDIFGIIEEELEPFELKEEVSDIPTLGLERKYCDFCNLKDEKSKGLDIAKSFNNNTAVTLSTTVNYKLNKNESKYVVVRPLVHSIFIPWVCGIDNEEDYRTVDFYGKEVRVNYEFVYSEISIIEKDGEQPYTAYSVLDISDDEYMFEVAKTELQTARAFGENISGDEIVDFNLLRQGFYMTKTSSDIPESDSSAAKLLTTDKGMVKFYLKDDGNLVLTYGSDIIWQTHTDFLDNMASDMRFSIKKNGHLVLEAKNILVDGYRKDEWIPVWDSLPYDLDFNVGVAPRDQYKLLLAAPTKNTTPSYKARLELYDEYNVLIWSSEENLCKHYKGYILPQNYGIPTKIDIEPKFGVKSDLYCYANKYCDVHSTILTNIKYVHTGVYTSSTHDCSNKPFLQQNEGMISPKGRFKFILTNHGNVLFKDGSRTMWESKTSKRWFATPPYYMFITDLGELVVRDSQGYNIWSTYISEDKIDIKKINPPFNIILNDNGEFYIKDSITCNNEKKCDLLGGKLVNDENDIYCNKRSNINKYLIYSYDLNNYECEEVSECSCILDIDTRCCTEEEIKEAEKNNEDIGHLGKRNMELIPDDLLFDLAEKINTYENGNSTLIPEGDLYFYVSKYFIYKNGELCSLPIINKNLSKLRIKQISPDNTDMDPVVTTKTSISTSTLESKTTSLNSSTTTTLLTSNFEDMTTISRPDHDIIPPDPSEDILTIKMFEDLCFKINQENSFFDGYCYLFENIENPEEICENSLRGKYTTDPDGIEGCKYIGKSKEKRYTSTNVQIQKLEKRIDTEVPNYLWHMWPTKELNGYIIYSEPKIVAYESCNEVPRSKYIMGLKSNDVNGYNRIFPGEKIRDYYDLRSLQLEDHRLLWVKHSNKFNDVITIYKNEEEKISYAELSNDGLLNIYSKDKVLFSMGVKSKTEDVFTLGIFRMNDEDSEDNIHLTI